MHAPKASVIDLISHRIIAEMMDREEITSTEFKANEYCNDKQEEERNLCRSDQGALGLFRVLQKIFKKSHSISP